MNRITSAIGAMSDRVIDLEPDKVANLAAAVELDHATWFALGDKPSRLASAQVLTLDEAMVLHRIHTEWNTTATIPERMVFLQVMAEAVPALR